MARIKVNKHIITQVSNDLDRTRRRLESLSESLVETKDKASRETIRKLITRERRTISKRKKQLEFLNSI